MNVIYEAEPFYGVSWSYIVFCFVIILVALVLVVVWKKVDIGVRLFILLIDMFLLFMAACQVYTCIDAKHNVYDEYQAGNYLIAEGIIDSYHPAEEMQINLPDEFVVDGLDFQVPGFVSAWGYPLKQANGGVLKNGMHVRIYYVPYKYENVIMRIEHIT